MWDIDIILYLDRDRVGVGGRYLGNFDYCGFSLWWSLFLGD